MGNFQKKSIFLRDRDPRCVWMVLVICNLIQLVDVFIPQITSLDQIIETKLIISNLCRVTIRRSYTSTAHNSSHWMISINETN